MTFLWILHNIVILAKLDGIRKLGLETSLKPDFLQKMAEFFTDEEGTKE
jgi:hypothetical protein